MKIPNYWITSDTHFGDENALKYRYRPFDSVFEMDRVMVENWNKYISPDDIVYHLGDFAVSDDGVDRFTPLLNGHIHLILGNHDLNRDQELLEDSFHTIYRDPFILSLDGDSLWFCHYPLQRHEELYTACGHIHDAFKVAKNMVNVGVDVWSFRPVPIKRIFEMRKIESCGYWDANVYPDADFNWRWDVSTKIKRNPNEPTMKILENEKFLLGR